MGESVGKGGGGAAVEGGETLGKIVGSRQLCLR